MSNILEGWLMRWVLKVKESLWFSIRITYIPIYHTSEKSAYSRADEVPRPPERNRGGTAILGHEMVTPPHFPPHMGFRVHCLTPRGLSVGEKLIPLRIRIVNCVECKALWVKPGKTLGRRYGDLITDQSCMECRVQNCMSWGSCGDLMIHVGVVALWVK